MNAEIVQRITEWSNSYSYELWNRFMKNESSSEEEKAFFQKLHESLRSENTLTEDIWEFMSSNTDSPVLSSLFQPGATDDIFINIYPAFLNNWVHYNEFFEMIYVERGDIVDWIDGVEVHLETHELCIHNPKARHQILKMDEQTDLIINILLPVELFRRSFYSLLMENEQLDQFFNNYMVSSDTNPNYMAFHDTSSRVDTIIELLVEEFLRGKNSSRFVMESTLVVLFGELMRSYKSDPFLKELIAYISANLTDVSMSGAAAHFGYHKNYFPHVLKKHSTRTFWDLVTEIRIQKASNLLLLTDSSIEEISESVGYKSTASFYEHFFQRYHMTPKSFRQEQA